MFYGAMTGTVWISSITADLVGRPFDFVAPGPLAILSR